MRGLPATGRATRHVTIAAVSRDHLLTEPSIERRAERSLGGPGGIRFLEIGYPAACRVPRHEHGAAYVCLVVAGGLSETYGRTSRTAGCGDVLWYEAGESHAGALANQPTSIFHIEIEPETLERWIAPTPTDRRPSSTAAVQGGWTLQLRRWVLSEDRDPLISASLLVEALAEATGLGTAPAAGSWMGVVRDRIHGDLEVRPTLSELSRLAGLHPSHLARAFRRQTGLTIGQYRRRVQVDRAAGLLARSTRPPAEIALEAGFSDQSHMGRVLKRVLGVTPAALRRWCGGRES